MITDHFHEWKKSSSKYCGRQLLSRQFLRVANDGFDAFLARSTPNEHENRLVNSTKSILKSTLARRTHFFVVNYRSKDHGQSPHKLVMNDHKFKTWHARFYVFYLGRMTFFVQFVLSSTEVTERSYPAIFVDPDRQRMLSTTENDTRLDWPQPFKTRDRILLRKLNAFFDLDDTLSIDFAIFDHFEQE